MLTFFRKIRKSLLGSGATGTYLLYAIGEIALVVIGILIALQINNWNEKRMTKATELKLLQELHQDLHETELVFVEQIEADYRIANSREVLVKVIEDDIPWHDSLQQHFNLFNFWNLYTIKRSAYNSIENWGINNVSNDSLRRKIVHIFQDCAQDLERSYEEEREIQLTTFNDIISSRLDWGNINKVKPVEYSSFIDNDEFRWRLKTFNTFKLLKNNMRERILQDIVETRKYIEAELSR